MIELQKRDAKKGIMDHSEDAARQQGRKMLEASQQSYTTRVEIRVRKLGIARELAEYLVDLERSTSWISR